MSTINLQSVIETGGKQYRVRVGDVLAIEKCPAEVGETVVFDKVLMIAPCSDQSNDQEESAAEISDLTQLGKPYVTGAKVTAEVQEQKRGNKIRVIKFKRRKHYKRENGHRQYLSVVKIINIEK